MTENDEDAFNELLSDVYAGYGKVITPGACRFYFAVLREFSISEIARAFTYLAKNDTSKSPPIAGEVHAAIVGGNSQERASFAWQEVIAGISKFGRYKSVCFSDPITNKVVEDLGWESLCSKTTDELGFLGHEFKKLYSSFCKTPMESYPTHVRGVLELRNPNSSFEIRFCGKEDKARLVYEKGSKPENAGNLLMIK